MEDIKILVEKLLELTGLQGSSIPVLRYILLIVIAIALACAADYLCRRIFVPLILKGVRKTDAKWDDIVFNERVLISACHIVPAVVIWQLIPWVFYQFPTVREILTRITAIYIVFMATRTVTVFISSLNGLETSNRRSSTQQYLKSFCGVLKIVMVFISAVVMVAIAFGKSPLALLTGLGATSAVLMLVFKDTIEGLVAGVRLTSNDMLHRGDWITVPSSQINGIVKDITLTTVKVQNFDNTIITISPTALVNGSFQNWIGMQESPGRRVQRRVYIDFRSIKSLPVSDDQEEIKEEELTNLGKFRYDIEQWLKSREDVNSQMLIMARQLEATQGGLPVEFYFFLKNKEWKEYEHHLAVIMEHIYVTAREYGLVIYQNFPEQSQRV